VIAPTASKEAPSEAPSSMRRSQPMPPPLPPPFLHPSPALFSLADLLVAQGAFGTAGVSPSACLPSRPPSLLELAASAHA
jgi:hypothetical protein